MTAAGVIQIADLEFDVEKAFVCGFVCEEELSWDVDVDGTSRRIAGTTWSPRAYLESIPWNVHHSNEFAATPLSIEDGETFGSGMLLPDESNCCLYVFSHNFLRDSTTRLRKIDGNRFLVEWTAECDVFFDDTYDFDLPLSISAEARFIGLHIHEADEAVAREMLSKHFDDGEFEFIPAAEDAGNFIFRNQGR